LLQSPRRRTKPAEPPVALRENRSQQSQWFWDHYDGAASEIVTAFANVGSVLEGCTVADIGCGDGIMSLGVCQRARPARLIGFDVNLTDSRILLERAQAEGAASELPRALEFRQSNPASTPAGDNEFDYVYSWSAFEHIAEPISVLSEIRRILKVGGVFFLQLFPFYSSARGSHLWDWFPEEFHHLRANHQDVAAEMKSNDGHPREWADYMADQFERLNRITLAELQRCVLVSGFDVRRVELITTPAMLTPELGRYSWTDLAVGGIKLIATPR
jgi:ubiquinone/menaquinone biosynthesis C-methylase UbiE